jgi:hypothetical protein
MAPAANVRTAGAASASSPEGDQTDMNIYERYALKAAKQRARHWERSYDVRVTVENPKLTVHFPDGETLSFRFRWSPLVNGVQWLTEDLRALDMAPGWYVRAKALAGNR